MSKQIKVAWTDSSGKQCSQWATKKELPDLIKQLEDAGATNVIHE